MRRIHKLLTMMSSGGGAFDYYVDSVNGNDANNGMTASTAFATISALTGKIEAGARIGLAKGSTWREQLTITANNVTVGTYGTGGRPVIDCRDVIAKAAISKTGGLTNTYQATVTFEAGVTDAQMLVWEDGTVLTYRATTALVDANPGSYYVTSMQVSPATLYIHASDSSDVSANAKVYRYNPRVASVYAQYRSSVVIRGIQAIGNLCGAGSIVTGSRGLVDDCEMVMGGKHSCYMGTGSAVRNSTFTDGCVQAGILISNAMLVFNENTPNGEGAEVENCTFTCAPTVPGYTAIVPIIAHYNTSGDFGTINVKDCDFTGLSSALITTNHTTTLNITNCTYTNCKYGFGGNPLCDTVNVTGCTWTSNVVNQRIVSNTAGGVLNIDNLTATATAAADTGYVFCATAGATITIQNSEFTVPAAPASSHFIYNNRADMVLILNGNTLRGDWSAGFSYTYLSDPGAGAVSITSDNNTFQTFRAWYNNTVYASLADWKATGRDANSTVG